ncbi:L-iditol 2-dehydrogenase [Roseospira visakhapatnamensis]|uniref:D-sorbitol dehydrogenase (Acceptor) n=1 Tax=Roseospira visakhapatnamensis TaxID=390880 RepID=A0A7W6RD76_9PROT|nr:L-iditol 2-dehydrogenase [Roseospira visakhapatnamensis]MBB4266380.1 D-sorbitol dehydrogenase (acceptor) [Roseospira visakhapatnamensis]
MKLQNKVALITGAARGIGLAVAMRYAEEGARVVLADIADNAVHKAAAEVGHGAIGVQLDVTRPESIDAAIKTTVETFGALDILVNNAGVFDLAPILEITRESYRTVFAVNVEGLLFTLQAAARQMVAQGTGGRIINFSSQAGRRGEGLVGVYCASKAAVLSLTQSAGLDLIRHGIRVNGIAPGVVDTPMWDHVDAKFAEYEGRPIGEKKRLVGEAVPYGRMGKPEDYAGAAVFLASDDAEYVVAQTLNVDGGNWMS